MSSIHELELSGIRSFGPETSQKINFGKPLTVILGQNGCGKTTIIECLKYATTGLLPPNSKKGQGFVHDPKVSNVSEVKGAIKLQFISRAGQRNFIGRNLRLTQKRTKQEFKALDAVYKAKDPKTGKIYSQSNKCSELDKLIPILLGVSTSMLENVIFCHQEDSNWPLQEGSVLKKRFDDIFESSRYTKALESIKSAKKNMGSKYKEAKHKVELVETHLKTYQRLNAEKMQHDEKIEEIDEKMIVLKEGIGELEKRAEKLKGKVESVDVIKKEVLQLKAVVESKSAFNMQKKREMSDELLQMLEMELTASQNTTLSASQNEEEVLDFLNRKISVLTRLKLQGEQDFANIDVEIHQLEQELKKIDVNYSQRKQAEIETIRRLTELKSKITQHKKSLTSFKRILEDHSVKYMEKNEDLVEIGQTGSLAELEARESRRHYLNIVKSTEGKIAIKKMEQKQSFDSQIAEISSKYAEAEAELKVILSHEKNHHQDKKEISTKLEEYQQKLAALGKVSGGPGMASIQSIEEHISRSKEQLHEHLKDQEIIEKLPNEINSILEEFATTEVVIQGLTSARQYLESNQDIVTIISHKKDEMKSSLADLCVNLIPQLKDELVNSDETGLIEEVANVEKTLNLVQTKDDAKIIDLGKDLLKLEPLAEDKYNGLKNELENVKSERIQKHNQRIRITAEKNAAKSRMDVVRQEIDELEDGLEAFDLSSILETCRELDFSSDMSQFTVEVADKVSAELDKQSMAVYEQYVAEKVKRNLLKSCGERILKKGSCPFCAQQAGTDLTNQFPMDFSLQVSVNPNTQLHHSLNVVDVSEIISKEYSTSEQREVALFKYRKGEELNGILAAAGKSFYESYRKNGSDDILRLKYEGLEKKKLSFEKNKSVYSKVFELKEKVLPGCEESWKTLTSEERRLSEEEKELAAKERELDSAMQTKETFLSLTRTLVNRHKDLMLMYNDIEAKKKQIVPINTDALVDEYKALSLKEVRHKLQEKTDHSRELSNKKESLRKKNQEFVSKRQNLELNLVQLEKQKLDLQSSHSQRIILQDRIRQQQELIASIKAKNKKALKQRQPLQKKVHLLVQERMKLSKEREGLLAGFDDDLKNVAIDINSLQTLEKDLSKFNLEKLSSDFQEVDKGRIDLQSNLRSLERNKQQVLDTLQDARNKHKVASSTIKEIDTLSTVLTEEKALEKLKMDVSEKEKKMKEKVGNVDQIQRELDTTNKNVHKQLLEREKLLGMKEELHRRKTVCMTQLKDRQLKNVEQRHVEALINEHAYKYCENDLARYYAALDKTLVQFHFFKIREINEQIKELWQLTYRGGDIDTIEIRADSNEVKKPAPKKRKTNKPVLIPARGNSYNYRVVMRKGPVELDMRGRCSAGQKILASIIIRMALATTFSANCGIFALDEPTTNLDAENKRSLAIALGKILKVRGTETNFQLVIITHDKDFIAYLNETMAGSGRAKYYEVQRQVDPITGKYLSFISKMTYN
eukprot:maker-scaffold_8-snap-gene-9.25-mRNA-1 protein AED:0.27 eAED:0.27 QI:0/0/0/1/1/1/2/0/1489